MVLHDEGKADSAAIEKLDQVQGVFSRAGQYQIIFGIGIVNKIYKALEEVNADVPATSATFAKPAADSPKKKNPIFVITKILSNIFVPILPFIVASGLLRGLTGMIKSSNWAAPDSAWMIMLDFFSTSALLILPVIIGFSAAKEFGGSPVLGAFIGGLLVHSDVLKPGVHEMQSPAWLDAFGFQAASAGYQGTVIPVLMSVYLMSKVETGLKKVVHPSLALFVVPLATVLFTGIISLLAIGPFGALLGNWLTQGLEIVYTHGVGFIGGFLFGGFYPLIVITGLHHTFHAVEFGLIANPKVGVNFLLPVWSMANIAQGGAGLAIYFKTRNKKLKETAMPAALSAFFGITEPVIFGMNLRLRKPFIGGCIGGAAGGAYVVFAHVAANSYGLTGLPMLILAAPLGLSNLFHYLTGFVISVGFAFMATWIIGFDEDKGVHDV
ncbi:PTS system sucrose-specific IIB component (Glc family) /PTS system sucrose-specific IIC component (Glc family) [Paenibacillus prosopidis]|uniref:PTS system sucrose-specific IIB component (Glc family) /PTS system sucrose-specific IIC component (Glc family) n=1 Tax=Paenibacillus prosopidis TaxID=630520 RepID=A0A368W9C1_9BACL|nr:PTS system sucrose-specific IIB component (Glc family) /PTS system sucrose-specific IIC component (Glc family) [Paenibacillus prosopidis]